jgi:Leishmanolysin
VAEVVTPSVAQVVRNHFDCQELPGAELESGEYLPLSNGPQTPCFGDHWERRLFKSDLMNPVVEDLEFNSRVSTINLAYFADSGWYQVDLSRAASASGWGRAAGCDFVEQQCINAEGQVPERFQDSFCSHSPEVDDEGFAFGIDGCTPDLTKKASCSIELYQGELPSEYQYFNGTYGSNVGGRDALMDYCPVFAGFTNGLCSDPSNEALVRVDRIERFGDRNSRCIPGLFSTRRTALCLRIACVVEDSSFHVQVDGVWKQCAHKDQVIETARGDRVFCPDPIRVCPTFYCQRDCLGTDRVCNYTQGKCVCAGNCSTDSEGPENFYDGQSNTSTSLPDEDSPLSDYYVPTSRMLRDERRFLLDDWEIACLSLGCFVVLGLAAYWFYQTRQANLALSDDAGDNPDDRAAEPVGGSALDPNKAKMIASVVLDLRMNTPNLRDDALPDRASETDLSLTDTEGGGTYVTDLSSSDFPSGNGEGFGSEGSPGDYVDPLAAPCVVRRRNVH